MKQFLQRKIPVLFQKDNKEKRGCKRVTKWRRQSSHRGCWRLGDGCCPLTPHTESACGVPGSWEIQGSTGENPPWMESWALCPCAYKQRLCTGRGLREWFRFVVGQKAKEGRGRGPYSDLFGDSTAQLILLLLGDHTQGKNAKGHDRMQSTFCFFAWPSPLCSLIVDSLFFLFVVPT